MIETQEMNNQECADVLETIKYTLGNEYYNDRVEEALNRAIQLLSVQKKLTDRELENLIDDFDLMRNVFEVCSNKLNRISARTGGIDGDICQKARADIEKHTTAFRFRLAVLIACQSGRQNEKGDNK